MANPEPIPQGATIGEPIPQGATIGEPVAEAPSSASGQPAQSGILDKAKNLYNEYNQGVVQGLGSTVAGVGNLLRKGIDTASSYSPSRAIAFGAEATGLAPKGSYEGEEKIRQGTTNKVKETLVPQTGQTALEQMSQPHGLGQWLGYGGENLTEFILGDEALKGLSLADKLKQAAGAAQILQKSPRIMRALQLGADVSKAAAELGPEEQALIKKSPVLARLVGAGMDALRQGTVQAAQTEVKSGGDTGKAVKEGGEMAATSAALGVPGAVAGGLISKAKGLGETLETAKAGAEKAKQVAAGTEEVAPQIVKPIIEAPAEGVVPQHSEIADTAKNAVDTIEKNMHVNFDKGINKISDKLKGKTISLDNSPLADAAKAAQASLKQEPKGLTERLGKSLQGMIPGTERGEKMTAELLGEGKKAGEDKTPSWLLGEEVKGEAGAGTPPKEEALTVDNLINYRQRLTNMLPQLPYDDPNKQVLYKLVDGVDKTIQQMADKSGNPEISSLYKDLRDDYKHQVQFFDPASAKKAGNQIGYQVAQKLQAGTASGQLNNIPQYLLSGNNSLAKVRAAKDLLGDESVDNLAIQTIRRWAQDATNPETGQLNPKKLVDQWNKIPANARSEFFSKANDGYRQMMEDLSKSPEANKETLDRINKLIRFGIFPAAGALVGRETEKQTGIPRAEVWGALAGILYGGGRKEIANDIVKYLSEHPGTISGLSKAAEAAKPVTKSLGPALKQQAGQAVMGKPSALSTIYQGAAQPLSEEQ